MKKLAVLLMCLCQLSYGLPLQKQDTEENQGPQRPVPPAEPGMHIVAPFTIEPNFEANLAFYLGQQALNGRQQRLLSRLPDPFILITQVHSFPLPNDIPTRQDSPPPMFSLASLCLVAPQLGQQVQVSLKSSVNQNSFFYDADVGLPEPVSAQPPQNTAPSPPATLSAPTLPTDETGYARGIEMTTLRPTRQMVEGMIVGRMRIPPTQRWKSLLKTPEIPFVLDMTPQPFQVPSWMLDRVSTFACLRLTVLMPQVGQETTLTVQSTGHLQDPGFNVFISNPRIIGHPPRDNP